MTAEPIDVHVHAHPENLASQGPWGPQNGPDSAGRPARARVISHLKLVGQEPEQEKSDPVDVPLGASLLAEMRESTAAAAADSDWAEQHLTPYEALETVFPDKGEAGGNPAVWTVMALAGLARLGFVTLGHLIALAGATRIRAGLFALLLLAALTASWIAGHAI